MSLSKSCLLPLFHILDLWSINSCNFEKNPVQPWYSQARLHLNDSPFKRDAYLSKCCICIVRYDGPAKAEVERMSSVQHVQAYKQDCRIFRLAGVAFYQAVVEFVALIVVQVSLSTGKSRRSFSAILLCSLILLLPHLLPATVLGCLQVGAVVPCILSCARILKF